MVLVLTLHGVKFLSYTKLVCYIIFMYASALANSKAYGFSTTYTKLVFVT